MTRIRKEILDQLKHNSQPLTAAQIYENRKTQADLASIYRGLQFLEKKGLAESFSFRCGSKGTERYYSSVNRRHTHYMHCSGCHHFFPIDHCPLSPELKTLASNYNFTIESHTLTIVGKCKECAKKDHS